MRHIGQLPNEKQARAFGDFLVTQNIPNEVELEADGSATIWIIEDDHLPAAQEWLEKFQAAPGDAQFNNAAAQAARTRKAEARDAAKFQSRIRTRKSLFPTFGGYGVGVLTYALIVLCVAVAFYSKFGRNEALLRQLLISDPDLSAPGFLPDVFRHGEVWRLLTPVFLHFNVLHLLFNMMWLYQLGCLIEARQGSVRLLWLVIVTGVLSNLAQYAVDGPFFGGMSGVVYALAGYVWMRGKYDRGSGLFLSQQSVVILLVWLALCFTGFLGPIANYAHLGGLVCGIAIGRITAYFAVRRPE